MKQTTIAKKVHSTGIGLHKGEPINLSLEPLGADSGIIIYRSDLNISFKADINSVVNTQMATVIGSERGYVSTIEHLLSAINGYGIDNIRIVVDSNEIPVMDGSAISFCMMLDEAGISYLEADKKALVVKKVVEVKKDNKFVRVEPSNGVVFDYTIDFNSPVIGKESFVFKFSKQSYIKEIARARTFGFLKDVQYLRSKGLALGGSLENAIVIGDDGILNPEGLRYENEFVRHKILDAIGDMALIGYQLFGNYISYAGSHELNHLLTKEIFSNSLNYEIVSLKDVALEYQKAFA